MQSKEMTNSEKYHYGLHRSLILNKDFDPITQIFYGDRVLCPTFFGYTWATISDDNSLWATNDTCFFMIERINGLYTLSLFGDKKILKMVDFLDNDNV